MPNAKKADTDSIIVQITPGIMKCPEFKETIFGKLRMEDLTQGYVFIHGMKKLIMDALYDRNTLDKDIKAAKKK